ncbi:hypothetical protein F5Y11DRAFT_301651 [Daldinia sp. FL1419]|nr:hypothetical protein F5Y11DRAFT_301651 [Daldinia sp. FL1419]
MELGCSVISPLAPHKHTHTVIFLHGRGDTSRNMADALLSRWTRDSRGRSLVDEFPSVRWVFPVRRSSFRFFIFYFLFFIFILFLFLYFTLVQLQDSCRALLVFSRSRTSFRRLVRSQGPG